MEFVLALLGSRPVRPLVIGVGFGGYFLEVDRGIRFGGQLNQTAIVAVAISQIHIGVHRRHMDVGHGSVNMSIVLDVEYIGAAGATGSPEGRDLGRCRVAGRSGVDANIHDTPPALSRELGEGINGNVSDKPTIENLERHLVRVEVVVGQNHVGSLGRKEGDEKVVQLDV